MGVTACNPSGKVESGWELVADGLRGNWGKLKCGGGDEMRGNELAGGWILKEPGVIVWEGRLGRGALDVGEEGDGSWSVGYQLELSPFDGKFRLGWRSVESLPLKGERLGTLSLKKRRCGHVSINWCHVIGQTRPT